MKQWEEDKDRDPDQDLVEMDKERKISQKSFQVTEVKKKSSSNNSVPLKLYSS